MNQKALLALSLLAASASGLAVARQPQAAADATIAVEAVVPTALPAATPTPGPSQDQIWQKIILGTWQAVDSPDATKVNGETTFTPDGKAVGYTTATYIYGSNNTKDVRINLKFNWKIVDGVLTLDHYVSDPADFFPKTHSRRFEIKSLNDTGAVLRDLIDDQEIYRRRKPG